MTARLTIAPMASRGQWLTCRVVRSIADPTIRKGVGCDDQCVQHDQRRQRRPDGQDQRQAVEADEATRLLLVVGTVHRGDEVPHASKPTTTPPPDLRTVDRRAVPARDPGARGPDGSWSAATRPIGVARLLLVWSGREPLALAPDAQPAVAVALEREGRRGPSSGLLGSPVEEVVGARPRRRGRRGGRSTRQGSAPKLCTATTVEPSQSQRWASTAGLVVGDDRPGAEAELGGLPAAADQPLEPVEQRVRVAALGGDVDGERPELALGDRAAGSGRGRRSRTRRPARRTTASACAPRSGPSTSRFSPMPISSP